MCCMKKGWKAALAIIVDLLLMALIIFSVYIIMNSDNAVFKNICKAIIVISIPVGFFMTYMSFAGDKYDYDIDAEWDEEEAEDGINN